VTFRVERGGGGFAPADSSSGDASTRTVLTDADGIARARWVLGSETGRDRQRASATFEGNPGFPATFLVTAVTPGAPEATAITGVVQDRLGQPIEGVRAVVRGAEGPEGGPLEAFTGSDGRFVIDNVPPGGHRVGIEGSTADDPARNLFYPTLDMAIEALPGVINELRQPVILPFLDLEGAKLVGGDEDVVLEMAGVPGFALKVFAHSTVLPDGTRAPVVMSSSQVSFNRVPMPPPQGATPLMVGTLQPAGVRFDPPAQVIYPNFEGLAPGDVADIFAFHHDIGEFVNMGPGTVSEDGSVVVSDPGFGLTRSGWHCLIRMPGSAAVCANDCRGRIQWSISANGSGGGSSEPVRLGTAANLADSQQATVTVIFSPGGGSNDPIPVWNVADPGVAEIVGTPTNGNTVTIRGVEGGMTTLTSPVYRIPVPAEQGGDRTCQVEVDVAVVDVTIEEADVTMDLVKVKLEPAGLSGELKLELIEPDNHVIRSEIRTSGTHEETFDIPNLARGEYMKVKATWLVMEASATDELDHHIKVLGKYRHSQYNTPEEAQCAGPPERAYITEEDANGISQCFNDPPRNFTVTTLQQEFISQVNLNGSGISTNFGDVQRDFFCPTTAAAPSDASGRTFRQRAIEPACSGLTLGDNTVARRPGHPDLDCGDQVFIQDVGLKTVTDLCPVCPDMLTADEVDQLDNFTTDARCSGINDLARNAVTIKIF